MARVLLCHQPGEKQPILDIALSERNLIVLLSKLYTPGSQCTFLNGDVPEGFAHAALGSSPTTCTTRTPPETEGRPDRCIRSRNSCTPPSNSCSVMPMEASP